MDDNELIEGLRKGRLIRESETMVINGMKYATGEIREAPHPLALTAADRIVELLDRPPPTGYTNPLD